ncbi:hypothetical protein, partial [Salmonella sp. SAL4432]|uniref:hypothetical protein n=1 Tax=Salmonella sp. SAL4432 TaxID=3159887 RepID=UPI00397CCF04
SGSISFDAGNVGSTYTWTLNNTVVSNDQTYDVTTGTAGDYTLELDVLNPFNGCSISDEVIIRVNPLATFNITAIGKPSA